MSLRIETQWAANEPKVDATRLFDEFIPRNDLPGVCLPIDRGAFVASERLVRHATENCPPISRYRRWRSCNHGSSKGWVESEWIQMKDEWILSAWRHGEVWSIQRRYCSQPRQPLERLGFRRGPSAICAHTSEAAKRLAEYYHLAPAETAGGVLWTRCDQE
jgi:hypothetical protein